MPDDDRQFIQRATRWGIVLAVTAALLFGLLWVLKSALTPLVAAFILAYLLDPLIDRFEARRIPRSVGILILLFLAGLIGLLSLLIVLPRLQQDIASLVRKLPEIGAWLSTSAIPWAESTFRIQLPHSLPEALSAYKAEGAGLAAEPARKILEHSLGVFSGTLGMIVGLLLIPIIAFYFLVEFDNIKVKLLDYVPVRWQPWVRDKALKVDALTSSFIRGQFTLCVVEGALYGIGYALIGIDGALVIGLAAGLLIFIPYVGHGIALVAGLLMGLIEYGVDYHLLLVVGWYAVIQLSENFILLPKIVGESLGLHPVAVIVALMIAGDLLGFLGLLIAVPGAAIINVFVLELLDWYKRSEIYRGSDSQQA